MVGTLALGLTLAAACSRRPRPASTGPATLDAGLIKAARMVDAAIFTLSGKPDDHRAQTGACGAALRVDNGPMPRAPGCQSDAECKDQLLGQGDCVHHGGGHDPPRNECKWAGCSQDADCGGDHAVCACNGGGWRAAVRNVCLSGNCRVDADCGAGGFCSSSKVGMGDREISCDGALGGFFCHTAADQCMKRVDCARQGDDCVFSEQKGHWVCQDISSFCPVG